MAEYSISYGEHEEYAKVYMESKGWISCIEVKLVAKTYALNFYDPVRLAQNVSSELSNGNVCFFEKNLIVIERVTEENIRQAIEKIITSGQIENFIVKDIS